jgi:hypothetical protein
MKKFLLTIIAGLIFVAVTTEILLRLTGKVTDVVMEENFDGDYLYKPYQQGKWIRGANAEIVSRFHINSTGWNSAVDYRFDHDKKYIALIGDSYIEGFHVSPDSSIGRKLEKLLPGYHVHEYGKSGANAKDFSAFHHKFCNKGYDKIFIFIRNGDFLGTTPNVASRGNLVPLNTKIRLIYSKIALLRYLNIQLGILKNISAISPNLLKNQNNRIEVIPHKIEDSINFKAYVSSFPQNVFFVFEEGSLNENTVKLLDRRGIKITHTRHPINFGFDYHWSNNGRWNVAETLATFLR